MKQLYIILLFVVHLASCSSSNEQKTHYYLLNSGENTQQLEPLKQQLKVQTLSEQPVVIIKLTALPEYLMQPSLVLQVDDHKLHYSHFNRWAEPLDKAIPKALIADLNRFQNNEVYVTSDDSLLGDHIMINIEYFHADNNGQVVLSGAYYHVLANNKQHANTIKSSFSHTVKLTEDGYSSMVESMRAGIRLLAKQLLTDMPYLINNHKTD